jgi:hypothetical protein
MEIRGQRKNHRRYPGIKGPRPDNYKLRKQEADENQAKYDLLTPQQKLEKLDDKLGRDIGAKRQRSRLLAMIEAQSNKQGTQS